MRSQPPWTTRVASFGADRSPSPRGAATRGRILQIGGPENLTFNQLVAAIQETVGRTSAPRHDPPLVLRLMAQTAGPLGPELGRQARGALLPSWSAPLPMPRRRWTT